MTWYRLVLAVGLLAALGCSGGGSDLYDNSPPPAPPPPPPAPPPPPPPPPQPGPASIDVEDSQFDPASVNIARGSTVTWTWRGGLGHNVTFEDGIGSSPTQTNGTLDRSFNTAGTFRFRCTVHSGNFTSGMSGSVVVQ